LTLNERALARILLESGIENKKVCVLSVVGGFRQGKSFLLDFFIRYLENSGKPGWEGEDDAPLTGFTWRGGSKRETTGLWMWSDPFIVKLPKTNEEIAIILLDTQGTFDTQSTMRENVTIFGLGTLISSMEIYNLMKQIREDDLQSLQLFTEYGILIGEGYLGAEADIKPFQKLRFLVRDWYDKEDHVHGVTGGLEYLDGVLKVFDAQHDDLKSVRLHIRECFEELDCYLMPHPGMEVVEDRKYDGRLSAVRQEFREHLLDLVQDTITNPVVKKVNGNDVCASELYTYVITYMEMFKNDDLPEPRTALQATALATHINAIQDSIKFYESKMVERTKSSYVMPEDLIHFNNDKIPETIQHYRNIKKIGGKEMTLKYENELEIRLSELWLRFEELNKAKFSLSSLKTPISLAFLLVLSYVLSHSVMDLILSLVGLSFLLAPLDLLFWTVLLSLLFYLTARVAKVENPALARGMFYLDQGTTLLWNKGLSKVTMKAQTYVTAKGTEMLLKKTKE